MVCKAGVVARSQQLREPIFHLARDLLRLTIKVNGAVASRVFSSYGF
jgi:hypothetical protein